MKNCPSCDAFSDLIDGSLPLVKRFATRHHIKRCASYAAINVEERRLHSEARALFNGAFASPRLRL